jgi:hypothetical protein
MDTLEKRMEHLNGEVDTYRQRCSILEQQNSSLQQQLQKLQAQLSAKAAVSPASCKGSFLNQVCRLLRHSLTADHTDAGF